MGWIAFISGSLAIILTIWMFKLEREIWEEEHPNKDTIPEGFLDDYYGIR